MFANRLLRALFCVFLLVAYVLGNEIRLSSVAAEQNVSILARLSSLSLDTA
jgi:hypothetical protein